MSNKPQMTIITPVYNGLPYIKECVGSVLAQDFQDWEMLISDDGSNDGTRAYLETITDSRIQVFMQEKNLGIFGNLNFLFKKAIGTISQILCQDDYFINAFGLSKIIKYWILNTNKVGFVRFNHDEKASCKLTALQKEYLGDIVSKDDSDLMFFLFGNIPGNLSNVSLRTELVKNAGGFREDLPYAGDFEFWSRAARLSGMGIEKEFIIYVRRHAGVASIYLNKKGELLSQNATIVSDLFNTIQHKKTINSFWLKLHATINYDNLPRYVAVKNLLKGSDIYLKELNKVSAEVNYTFKKILIWLLFITSGGGRFFRVFVVKHILKA